MLKDSALYDAMVEAYAAGAVIAASGAGATLLCDPMVDPRGGAYTVGLGLVRGLAVFPYHGSAAAHLRERSIELLPPDAVLVGLDEHTAIVRLGGRAHVARHRAGRGDGLPRRRAAGRRARRRRARRSGAGVVTRQALGDLDAVDVDRDRGRTVAGARATRSSARPRDRR